MLRTFTLSLFLLLFGSVSAQTIAVETFNTYTPGDTLGGAAGGSGWAGPWRGSLSSRSTLIQDGGLTNTTLAAGTSGNSVRITATGSLERSVRLFSNAIDTLSTTEFWFSAHLATGGSPAGTVGNLILLNTALENDQRVIVGKRFGSNNIFAVGAGSGATNTGVEFDGESANLVVGHMVLTDGGWDLDLYVDPDVSSGELTEADAQLVNKRFPASNFDGIAVRIDGTGTETTFDLDDIYLGNRLTDVIAEDLVEVTVAPTFAVETFNDYTAGDTLGGLDGGSGWGGPWRGALSSQSSTIQGDGLTNPVLGGGTSGNSLRIAATGGLERSTRLFASVIDTLETTDFWFSSHLAASGEAGGGVGNLILIDTTDGEIDQQVIIGKPFPDYRIFAGGPGQVGGNTFTGLTFDGEGGSASFVVGHMTRVEGAWELDLYVNPDVSAGGLAEEDAQIVNKRYTSGNFSGVAVRIDGATTELQWDVDDIYFGANYQEVVPEDLEVEQPPMTAAFAVETFNSYEAGDTLSGLDGGTGWAGPWMHNPSSDNSTIRASGLTNNTFVARTSGNSLRLSADGMLERSVRMFETRIDTTDNADFWFSSHLAASGTPGGAVGNLILIDTTEEGEILQPVLVGKPFPDFRVFAGGTGQVGGNSFTGASFDGTGATFVVGHMVRDSGRWELDLYVNPDPTADTLAQDSAQIIGKRYTAGNFIGIAIRIDGTSTDLNWDVDDIYFGSSYRDVVPTDLENATEAPPGASEPFSYEVGSELIGQDGGSGWAGPWALLSASGGGTIEAAGITSLPLLQQTAGPKVRLDEYLRAVRPLEGTYGDSGREFWLGYFFDVDDAGANVAHLVLADTATYAATGGGGQLVQIGKPFPNTNLAVIPAGAGPLTAAGSDVNEGAFVVAHIITDGTAAADRIEVWINPSLEGGAPSADTAATTASVDLTNWNGIGFKFEGDPDQPTSVSFDEIRLGFSFGEVIPTNLTELDPPNAVRPAVELFDYTAGQDLNGAEGGEGWSGPWTAESGTILIAEGSVENPRTCADSTNSAVATQMGSDMPLLYRRSFTNPFGTDPDSETFYASFTLNGVNKDIGNNALISFVSGEENVLSIGGVQGLSSLAVVRNDELATPQIAQQDVIQGTKWVVVRMDINSVTGLATAYVFIDPLADAIPATENALFTVENVSVVDGITGMTISAQGAQGVELRIDDIRVGTSYRNVSCQFGSDDPNLLAYEPFNYDANTSLFEAGGENAFWLGPWTAAALEGDNTAIVTEGSLDIEALDEEANRVEINYRESGSLRIDRELAFPIESDGRTYWLSFLMNTTDGATSNNVGNLILLNGADQRMIFGRLFGQRTLGVAIPGGAARRSAIVDEGLNWIVARFQTGATSETDTVTMWVNPPASATAPDTTSAGFAFFFDSPALLEGITGVRLRTEGGEVPYVTQFDEITVATEWSSIVDIVNSIRRQPTDPFGVTAYPNPFNTALNLEYTLPETGPVTVDLLDVSGRLVQRLRRGEQRAGAQRISVAAGDTQALPNGFYFVRIEQFGRSTTRKVVLLR